MPELGQVLIFQDAGLALRVRLDGETVWLTQLQMAELFQTTKQNISLHIQNILNENEVSQGATVKEYLTVQLEGNRSVRRHVDHYNLEMILAVGYRVRSLRGTQFRQWATARLSELLVKGFTLDDERIKAGRSLGQDYFDELLARIRDIRSSERLFYQKITDIYATSIDYDPSIEATQKFFQTVQNKMHWAAHGQTAAEVIHSRANAAKPRMGMTNWVGTKPSKAEAVVAKNYLAPDELNALNRIVTAYLELAELQALNRKPMYMRDWIAKLYDFLRLSGREILTHAGTVSREQAAMKAAAEFEEFHRARLAEPSRVENDFDAAVKAVAKLPAPSRKKKKS